MKGMRERRLERLCKREGNGGLRQSTVKVTHRKRRSKTKFKILITYLGLNKSQY